MLHIIENCIAMWIGNCLSDREHFVSLNQTHSPPLNRNKGIPLVQYWGPKQRNSFGSILGPLLFLIIMTDIVITYSDIL